MLRARENVRESNVSGIDVNVLLKSLQGGSIGIVEGFEDVILANRKSIPQYR